MNHPLSEPKWWRRADAFVGVSLIVQTQIICIALHVVDWNIRQPSSDVDQRPVVQDDGK
jgi:hypothetical protein